MMAFLLAPAMTFFSTRLYREALQSGIGRGFAYLVYMTALFLLLAGFLCQFLLLPLTSNFTDWLVQITPEMMLTQSGLNVGGVKQPYLVEHPALGPLYLIDTTKSLDELMAEKSRAFVLIGKEHLAVRTGRHGEIRVFDLRQAMDQSRAAGQPIRITKNLMHQLNVRLRALVVPVVLIFLAPLFFIWKLLVALFYSLIALLLNRFRKEKFRYGSLFTLACYAISPVTIFQVANISIPEISFDLNFYFSFALTVLYLVYGMFVASRHTK